MVCAKGKPNKKKEKKWGKKKKTRHQLYGGPLGNQTERKQVANTTQRTAEGDPPLVNNGVPMCLLCLHLGVGHQN